MSSLLETFPRESPTILQQLQHWVDTAGAAPCLYYGENEFRLDYAGFDELTNRIARGFLDRGLRAGGRLAVYSDNALLCALVMFGAWKAGAVYCPISHQLRGDLLAGILGDLQASLLICDRTLLAELNTVRDTVGTLPLLLVNDVEQFQRGDETTWSTRLETEGECTASLSHCIDRNGDALPIIPGPQDEASIIYTSGTTARPKGVVQSHSWLHALCATQAVWTHPQDVIHCNLPMCHIGGAFSLFVRGLWCGASVALWDRFSASRFWERIRCSGASIALLIDVMADWLLQCPEQQTDKENSLAKVHLQPLAENHAHLAQRFGIDFIVVGYGSSEVGNALIGFIDEFSGTRGTPGSSWKGYTKTAVTERLISCFGKHAVLPAGNIEQSGYMGVPSGFYELELRDRREVSATTQTVGQLALRPKLDGVLFARYLNRAAKTRSAMGDGCFDSFDVASVDECGRYYFQGRREGFLRVRGENVSAAYLEQVLETHTEILRSAVVGIPARQGGEEEIAAFVQPKSGSALQIDELRDWCEARLPGYMVPSHLLVTEQMPLTDTMKIDRGVIRRRFME